MTEIEVPQEFNKDGTPKEIQKLLEVKEPETKEIPKEELTPSSNIIDDVDRIDFSLMRFKRSGQYYTLSPYADATGSTVYNPGAANSLRAWAFFNPKKETYDRIAMRVTISDAGGDVNLGIYEDNGSLYPGRLILATDVSGNQITFETDSTGQKTITIELNLAPNKLYWLAWVVNTGGSGAQFAGIIIDHLPRLLGFRDIGSSTTENTQWQKAFTFADLPTTFPTGATIGRESTFPFIGLRKK